MTPRPATPQTQRLWVEQCPNCFGHHIKSHYECMSCCCEYECRKVTDDNDTRTRPHTRTAEHMQSAYAHGKMDGERAATLVALDKVIVYCKQEAKEYPDSEAWYDSTMEKVAEYCESLRTAAQEQRP